MYNKFKIVVNTAAGRRRYMQYLIPYIVSSKIVDRYDIWINTHNGADIEFFKQIAKQYSVVNLVWQPDGVVNGNSTINAFYEACTEPDTIYFKLDDDIIWMEPGLIEKMVQFRVENPQYFLVSPLVINNSLSTYLLQSEEKIKFHEYYNCSASHPTLWKSGQFATELHTWFINKFLKTGQWNKLHLGKKDMGMTRFSINAILWFGDEMRKFKGFVPGDDEEFLSCIYPTTQGLANAWNGDAIVSHFAFFTQREQLDKQNILEQYGEILNAEWLQNNTMREIHTYIQQLMADIKAREAEFAAMESPYKMLEAPKTLRSRVKKYIPKCILQKVSLYITPERKRDFIID